MGSVVVADPASLAVPHRPPPVGEAMRTLAASAEDVRVLADDDTEQRIPAASLQAGQRFVVRPGERIAADGEVLSGQSALDRGMMTGESVPIDAAADDTVADGTIALTVRLVVRADKVRRGPVRPPDPHGRAGPCRQR